MSDVDTLFNVIKQRVLLFFQRLQLLLQLIVALWCAHVAALLRWSLLHGKLLQLRLGLFELLAKVLILLYGLLSSLLRVEQILLLQRQLLFDILNVAARVV